MIRRHLERQARKKARARIDAAEYEQASADGVRSEVRGLSLSPEDRKSTRLNSSHSGESRMPSSA